MSLNHRHLTLRSHVKDAINVSGPQTSNLEKSCKKNTINVSGPQTLNPATRKMYSANKCVLTAKSARNLLQ